MLLLPVPAPHQRHHRQRNVRWEGRRGFPPSPPPQGTLLCGTLTASPLPPPPLCGTLTYDDLFFSSPLSFFPPHRYVKGVFRQYSDATFSTLVPQPAHMGLVGPLIVAEPGDTLVVVLQVCGGTGDTLVVVLQE